MNADFCELVTTNAANIGIDKSLISLQMRFDWPHNLLTYFQERGRGSRQMGSKLICILYGDLSSYVSLILQIVGGADGTVDEHATRYAIDSIQLFFLHVKTSMPAEVSLTMHLDLLLRNNCNHMLLELHEVMCFFCLNLGCQHVRGGIYLSTGMLDPIPALGSCTSCPICNQTQYKDFLPILWHFIFRVFDSNCQTPFHYQLQS
jgi:hypothetical protein